MNYLDHSKKIFEEKKRIKKPERKVNLLSFNGLLLFLLIGIIIGIICGIIVAKFLRDSLVNFWFSFSESWQIAFIQIILGITLFILGLVIGGNRSNLRKK